MKRAVAIAGAVLVLDQAAKALVRHRMPLYSETPVLPFFSVVFVENTGAIFGVMRGANLFLILLTFIILGFLWRQGRALAALGPLARAGLPLVWGGALGNLVDRVRFGAVTDFLDFHLGGWHWPAFNLADSAITTGITCLIIQNLLTAKKLD